MISINSGKRKDLFNYLLLGVFVFIAYLPVSSFLFALKNDALTDNFPNKYFFSAALHAGHLPLWNPYINFGLPLYADPGFAFWQPLTWAFGFIGYNIYTLSIEVLVYIWAAAIFMFGLGRQLRHTRTVAFCMAIMYACCGFFVGNLQHINFLTCAAFLPLAVRTFLQIQEGFTYKKLFYCSISLFLLTSGGHPAIPFASIYFLGFILLGVVFFKDDENGGEAKRLKFLRLLKTNLFLCLAFLALAAPMIYSYLQIQPYFNRSQAVMQGNSLQVGFTIQSYLSFLFPFATTASSKVFENDSLMRNGYFSFVGFLFFVIALFRKKNKYQRIFILTGMLLLILSLGGTVKANIYPHLPFLKYIRTNGEYRVFALLSFIVVASFPLSQFIESNGRVIFNRFMQILAVICLLCITWVIFHSSQTTFFSSSLSNSEATGSAGIKWWLDHWTFYDRLFLNALILLFFIAGFFGLRKKIHTEQLMKWLFMADLLIFCWSQLPVTGVQQRSVSSIENYFSAVKPGIPLPSLQAIQDNIRPGENLANIIGCWSYYGKQPGTPELCDYPTLFTSTENYFRSGLSARLNVRPFIFLDADSNHPSSLNLVKYTPTEIIANSSNEAGDTLVLLQNKYPGWEAVINGEKQEIRTKYISFMAIALKDKNSEIHFQFNSGKLWIFVVIAIVSILTLFIAGRRSGPAK